MAELRNPTSPTQHSSGDTLHQAASRIGDAASQVKEKVQDAASTVAHGLENAWESTSSTVSQGAHAVARTAENFWDDATGLVRRHPVPAVLIAFGLGCLVASLLRVPRWTADMTRRMSEPSD
jgi:ElaB/YqjD/DUF883 family membrane-anchored ribosome-binding protein